MKKKRVKEEKKAVTYLRFQSLNCYHREDAEEQYGSWSEDNDISEQYTYQVKETQYWDVVCDFPVMVGQDVFVLKVTYSTGDSFGRATGKVEYVGVYETYDEARFVKKALEKHLAQRGDSLYNFKVTTPLGHNEEIYCGAFIGYFESVDNIEVIALEVKK